MNGDGTIDINGTDYTNATDVYYDYPELIDSSIVDFAFDGEVNG
jgi:hypothetical protein